MSANRFCSVAFPLVAVLAPLSCSSASTGSEETTASASEATDAASPIVSGVGGKCLDDSSGLTANGNKIQIWSCNGTTAQSWSYQDGKIVGPGGKCLDIHYDDQVQGTVVDLYQCNGTNAQKWTFEGTAIKSTSGLCLDVKSAVNANGTQVQVSDCNGTPAQVWHTDGSTGSGTGSGSGSHSGSGSSDKACTFDGRTIASGGTVSPAPYVSATVPFGDTCATETVTCEDGVLSPSDASATCTVSEAPPSTPSLRQYAVEQTNGGSGVWEVNSVKQFAKPTQAGNTIWVVATIPNDGAQAQVSVSDTQENAFTALLPYEQDNSKGTQTVWQFYAPNIKGDTGTADTVTVHWGDDNYKGVLIAEVAGVTHASLVGHSGNIQDYDAANATNSVTSGDIVVSAAETPALLLSVSMDTYGGSSDTGGDGYAGPLAGNGFTEETYMWDWDPGSTCNDAVACNLGAFETKSVTAAGSVAGLFTARAPEGVTSPGSYVTMAALFH